MKRTFCFLWLLVLVSVFGHLQAAEYTPIGSRFIEKLRSGPPSIPDLSPKQPEKVRIRSTSIGHLDIESSNINFHEFQMGEHAEVFSAPELAAVTDALAKAKPSFKGPQDSQGLWWQTGWLNLSRALTLDAFEPDDAPKRIDGLVQHPQSFIDQPIITTILPVLLKPLIEHARNHTMLGVRIYVQLMALRALGAQAGQQAAGATWQQLHCLHFQPADYTMLLMVSEPHDSKQGFARSQWYLKNGAPALPKARLTLDAKRNSGLMFSSAQNSFSWGQCVPLQSYQTRDMLIASIVGMNQD